MKAVVLAGGFGTRIQPLTNSVPKPMLPILNRPMMEHIIIKLRDDLGIKKIAILLYFKPEVIKEYFKDGSDFGVEITYVQPDDDYGTAGAVAFAREFLDERFIIVSGDLVTDFDFKKIVKFHENKKSLATITLTSVEDPLQFGVVIANESGEIKKFLEKPSWGEVFSDTINTGIYIFEPQILDYIPYDENFDFAKDLFPKLMAENITIWGCLIEGYWRDVGNPTSYRDVYQDIFDGKILLPYKGELKKHDNALVYIEKGTKLPKEIKLEGLVVLGKNVVLEEKIELKNVTIGDNSNVNTGSKIDSCTLWNDVNVSNKAVLKNCVVCNNNLIGEKVKVNDGVIIAEHCDIESKVVFERDVIVWPNKAIESGAIINNNIIWGDKYKSSIFEAGSVIGRTNIELSVDMTTKLAESFGSILPIGSKVYISNDYHKSSRMLKRAFLSGMLSTGVDVVDLFVVPSNVMRHAIAKNEDIVAGIHIRQSVITPIDSEVIFYTHEGLTIDTNLAKSIERIFFRESFRRVNYTQIGEILEDNSIKKDYIECVTNKIDKSLFKNANLRIVSDIMYGSTSDIYPQITNELGIESIILNAYNDDKKQVSSAEFIKQSQTNVSKIVSSMDINGGFLIYPNGQKLQIVCDKGSLVYDYIALFVVLEYLNITSTERKAKVFLPAWAPDFIEYKNLDITRGKYNNFKASMLREYDLIATTDGHFAFSEFGLNRDALYASFKILELIAKSGVKISSIIKELPLFTYKGENIACPSAKKGKMMRMFLEDSEGKKSEHIDGVKIWIDEKDWILMVPDQHKDFLNIYIQAKDVQSCQKILSDYSKKIEKWINE